MHTSLFDHIAGWQQQLLITDGPYDHGPIQHLSPFIAPTPASKVRCGKNTGMGRFPSHDVRHQRRVAQTRTGHPTLGHPADTPPGNGFDAPKRV